MRIYIAIFLYLVISTINYGQTIYEPQILILSPNEVKYDKIFEKEVSAFNKRIKQKYQQSDAEGVMNSPDFKKQPENIQLITKSELEFSKNIDFLKQVSASSEQYLLYRFYERFTNLLILLKDSKSDGSLKDLKSYSENSKLQYVLNFQKMVFLKEKGISYCELTVQLYDFSSNSILLEKTYKGDWNNPGFDFACEEKTIGCSLNNALSKALTDVIFTIASNSPTLKKDKELKKERFDVLISKYLYKKFDQQSLKNIIQLQDSTINVNISYQAIFNTDETKFVGFFLEQVKKQDLINLKDNKMDNNINIVKSKDIKDEGFLDDIPQNYAYIVTGIYYGDKWYYKKSNVTYFEAKNIEDARRNYFTNLQQWNFFKDNSTEINPDFWETYFFSKVESAVVKNKKEIEEYKTSLTESKNPEEKETLQYMIDDFYKEDLKNKEYFGLYQLVADKLIEEDKIKAESFENNLKEKVLNVFYEQQGDKNRNVSFIKMNGEDCPLIFPKNKSVILTPIVKDYGYANYELNYYVLIPDKMGKYDIYSWTYFKPIKPNHQTMFGIDVNEQLNKITKWDFSFDTLDDDIFWNKYVLLKEGDSYKYLKIIK